MAELAGICIGIVALIHPLAHASIQIADGLQDAANFGAQAKDFRARISIIVRQLRGACSILFDEEKFTWLDGRLFDGLDQALQRDIYDLLNELKRLLLEFVDLSKSHGIEAQGLTITIGPSNLSQSSGVNTPQPARSVHDSVSWGKLFVWSIKDKNRISRLVSDLEHKTSLLRLVIQDAVASMDSSERLAFVVQDKDSQALELDTALRIRQVQANRENTEAIETVPIAEVQDLRRIRAIPDLKTSSRVLIGRLKGQNVLVEKREFTITRTSAMDLVVTARVKELATLLSCATNSDLRVLQARGFWCDTIQGIAMLVYRIPDYLEPEPLTLSQVLELGAGKHRPLLELRFKLALMISEAIFSLHTLGWIHKDLRSPKILFFSRCSAVPTGAPVTASHVLASYEMKLAGFEFSRLAGDVSTDASYNNIADNAYRHPNRWGSPSESHTSEHDLYSLGAILLEIGLWESLDSLIPRHMRSHTTSAFDVQSVLAKHASLRLGYTMGSKYSDLVLELLCLCLGSSNVRDSGQRSAMESERAPGRIYVRVLDCLRSASDGLSGL